MHPKQVIVLDRKYTARLDKMKEQLIAYAIALGGRALSQQIFFNISGNGLLQLTENVSNTFLKCTCDQH